MDPSLLGSGGLTQTTQPSTGLSGAPPPASPNYNYQPSTAGMPQYGGLQQVAYNPSPGAVNNSQVAMAGSTPFFGFGGGQFGSQIVGQFGQNQNEFQANQQNQQKWSIPNDVNYSDYQRLGTQAQGWGAQGQTVLNDPRQAAALQNQAALAGGPTAGQLNAEQAQGQSISMLRNAAQGNGPTAADIQGQKSISDAMRAQLTAGASARGGAYQQAAAQQQAGMNAANIQAQGAASAAQLRAQELQSAQGQYAQAAGQFGTTQNQALAAQTQAAQAYQQGVQGVQGQALNYYQQQQQASQHQSDIAAQLAQAQVANDYGLSGTQLQTQTQQNIANQQQTMAGIGSAITAGGMVAMALASTGGAAAAARGAHAAGASVHDAARIGAQVGHAIGRARAGGLARRFAGADTEAARRAVMTPADMHAHLKRLRDNGKPVRALPGPATEPLAPQAAATGAAMARLAMLRGRAHATAR